MVQQVRAYGQVLQFPDDMSDDDMAKAIQNNEHVLNPNFKAPEGLSGIAKNVVSGTKQTGRMVGAGFDTIRNELAGVEDYAKASDIARQQETPIEQRKLLGELSSIDRDQGALGQIGDTLSAAGRNPMGTAQMITEQLPNTAVSLGGGYAGFKTGAAAGALFGPVGATIGGTIGFLGGMFLGNMLLETGGKAIEKASDEDGYTPEDRDNALREGAVKGAVITGVDAATLKLGSMVTNRLGAAATNAGAKAEAKVLIEAGVDMSSTSAINAALKSSPELLKSAKVAGEKAAMQALSKSKKVGIIGTGLVLETAGEGIGEYAGEMAATGKGDVVDATIEALSSATQSIAETAYNFNKLKAGNDLSADGMRKVADSVNEMTLKDGINNISKSQSVDEAIQAAVKTVSTKPVTANDVLKTVDPTLLDVERLTGLKPSEVINDLNIQGEQDVQSETSQKAKQKAGQKPVLLGNDTEIVLPDGQSIHAKWAVVDADQVSASIKEGINQPRDRTRAASDIQIQGIANNPDYRRLSDSVLMDTGSPTLSYDGLIVGGNGRFEGISRAHETGSSGKYRESLLNDALSKGIDVSLIQGIKNPVLVRQITQPFDTRKLAVASNSGTNMQYSGLELAKIDAGRMFGIEDLDIADNGDIAMTGANFQRIKQSLADYNQSEIAAIVDKNGALSQDGVKRIRNAILAKAYGNSETLGRMVESTDNDMRNVLGALTRTSGTVARVRSEIKSGAIPEELDITDNLLNAVETLAQIRSKGQPLDHYLSQENMFGDNIDSDSKEILQYLHDNIRSQKKMAEFINNVYGQIGSIDQSTEDIFGDNVVPTKKEVIDNAKPTEQDEQQGIFSQQKPSGTNEQESKTEADNATSDQGRFSRAPEERIKDRERAKQLERKLREQGFNFTVTAKDVRDFTSGDRGKENEADAAEKIAKIFGRRIVWIEARGDHAINGVVIPSIKDTIFIDVNTDKAANAVMGHELSHHLEHDKPEVYKELTRSLMTVIRDHPGYAKKYGIEGARQSDITKEIVGDIMGDNFTKPEFWSRVAEANPSVFKNIADTIISWLRRLIINAKARSLGSEQWVTDAQKAQDIVAQAVAQYTTQATGFHSDKAKFHSAFHGSPHDHDKFDSSKIGTGEGTQAYGFGHYFADNKEVAEHYKKILTTFKKPKELIALENRLDKARIDGNQKMIEHFQKAVDDYPRPQGKLYQVELAPKQDEYLLWDRPLSEQSDKVIASLENKFSLPSFDKDFGTAGEFYRSRARKFDSQEKASSELYSLGIRGIKYIDGSSRHKKYVVILSTKKGEFSRGEFDNKSQAEEYANDKREEGFTAEVKFNEDANFNYVIFDENDVTITAKFSKKANDDQNKQTFAQKVAAYQVLDAKFDDDNFIKNLDIDSWEALHNSLQAIRDDIANALENNIIDAIDANGKRLLSRNSTDSGNEWRITSFDADGDPLGHSEYRNAKRAVDDLFVSGINQNWKALSKDDPDAVKFSRASQGSLFGNNDNLASQEEVLKANFSKVAAENTLIAQHNLSVKNLLHADRMGGLAAPSIAVTDKAHPLKGFGEITLLSDKDLVDPKQGAKTYGSDIYSPRYPQLSYDFSGKAIKKLNEILSDGIEKTGDREFYNDSLENDPFRELTHSSAAMYQFLKEQGADPKLAFTKPKELPNESFRSFADSNMDSFDLSKDEKFKEAVKEHFAQISDREKIDDDAVSNLVIAYAHDVISYRDAKKNIGKIDHQATNSSLFRQITNSDLRNKFDDFLVDIINRAAPKERIFQGYTNSGNRRYIPHDIDNVIKLLKKDLRGGENFKYGLGSIRAKYSPQFKSIDQIRKSKNRLMDSKTFDLVKKEIQTELDSLNESLASYGTFSGFDNVENMLSDAAKMGISRALKDNGFENVPDSIKIDIQNFINKLKDMPTEYFEAKLLRAVKLGEFTAAIIPDDSTQQVKDILKKNGIEDVREYKAGDNEDRVKQINQIDRVMFSRVAKKPGDIEKGIFSKITLDAIREWGFADSINPDGSVSVYHGTSKANAKKILKSGKLNGHPYVALEEKVAKRFGNAADSSGRGTNVITLNIDPEYFLPSGDKYLTARIEGIEQDRDGVWRVVEKAKFSRASIHETININGVERPTRNSEGKLIPNPEKFYEWFGDSKVVDDKGRPLTVYHGTKASFDKFEIGSEGKNAGTFGTWSVKRVGIFFAEDPKEASEFATQGEKKDGANVLPVSLSIINPADLSHGFEYDPELYDALAKAGVSERLMVNTYPADIWELFDDENGGSEFVAALKEAGYDGAFIVEQNPDTEENIKVWVAFDPKQIKSAIGNNGEFSSDNDDIMFSFAGKKSETAEGVSPERTNSLDIPRESRFRKFQRKYQDSFNRFTVVKEWLADKGINLSQQADVYAAEERYHAKVANQVEDFREQIRNPLIEKIAKAGFTMDDIADYLEAQHAPEANAAIRKLRDDPEATAYGIADDEAREYLSKAPGELGKLANELRSITEQTKKLRLDGGLLNKDITDAWESTYKHYIPVKGAEQGNSGTGKGMSVKVKNKRRLGHGRRDEAVIENILQDHERAIMEVEKNRVGKHVVMMAAEIGIPELMTIGQPVKRQMLRNTTAYEVQVKGRTKAVFDTKEGANLFRQSLPLTDKKIALSDVVINTTADQRVVMSASPMLADNEINVYIDGHAIRVQINDELMARAYKKLGIEGYGEIVSAGRILNSYLSKVYTGYNPEFIMTNMVRDFTTGVINLTGEQGLRMAAKAISNYPKSFATLLRYAATNGKQSTDWIDAYRRNGGNTGAAYLSDMERLGNEVSSEYAAYQGVIANLKQGDMANAARAAGRKAYNATLKWIYNLNQAGENAMRLSAFKAMIDSGMTVNDAAKAAKNITVNFNRKGELGVEANAAYLFFNASVQGTAATLHALVKGKNKYQAWALASGLTTLGYLAAASLGGGSEDDYDKIDDYTKERNALIKSGDGYLKLPIPYGYGFFWNVGRSMADAQRKDELHTMPWHIAASAIEELTPFGSIVVGSDGEFKSDQVLGGALPTVAQIPYQISNNKQLFSGGELMPDSPFDQSQPDREKMWSGTKGTMYDQVAGWLAGAGMDVSPETLKFMTRTATGGAGALVDSSVSAVMLKTEGAELDTEEMPFIRKAYKEISIKDTRSAFYKAREEAKLAAEEFNRARRKNDLVAMQTVINDKKEMLALDAYADKLSEVIRYARDQQDAVRLNKDIPIAEKRLKLKELEISEAKFYDKYLDVFNINKIEMKKRSKNDLN